MERREPGRKESRRKRSHRLYSAGGHRAEASVAGSKEHHRGGWRKSRPTAHSQGRLQDRGGLLERFILRAEKGVSSSAHTSSSRSSRRVVTDALERSLVSAQPVRNLAGGVQRAPGSSPPSDKVTKLLNAPKRVGRRMC